MRPSVPPERRFPARCSIPSILTPSFPPDGVDFLTTGVVFSTTGSTTLAATFLTGDFFGAVFFGAVAAFWETGTVFFSAVFFGADVFGAFLAGLFFVVVFVFIIDEILGKHFRKSKKIGYKSPILGFEFCILFYNQAMLDKDFTPPKPRIAQTETTKRIKIIEWLIPEITQFGSAVILTGSMAYGQDYSITPDSDIDLQFLVTPAFFPKLFSSKYFQKYNTKRIEQWFMDGVFQQFSITFLVKWITVECHFWDEKTYKDILLYKCEKVARLRSQTKKTATDYAYSFDGEEDTEEYTDYKEGVYNLGVLPAYRMRDKKIFLSRPITNILGNAMLLSDDCGLKEIIEESKKVTKTKLDKMPREEWKTYSIYNTLPGKNKIAPELREKIW